MGTICVWEDEKVLETDGGDGHTTMGMYLLPVNTALKMVKKKMVKTVIFMFRIFYHNENKHNIFSLSLSLSLEDLTGVAQKNNQFH